MWRDARSEPHRPALRRARAGRRPTSTSRSDAPAILLPTVGWRAPAVRRLAGPRRLPDEWHDHLTTLFPEVRPRGHFELRSADAVAPQWYAAPMALAVGITYEPRALRAAADLLGTPDLGLLDRAGRLGLRDPAIASTAADLTQIALDGCAGLGPAYFNQPDLEQARAFFDQYTRQGRAPGDDLTSSEVAA